MAVSTSDVQYLSKIAFPKGYKDKDLYFNLPFTAGMKKVTTFSTARGAEVQVDYSLNNGVGGTPAGAVTNATATKGATFTVPQAHLYGYAILDGVVMRNAENSNDDTAVIDYAKKQFRDGVQALMSDLERNAFRSKTGSIAQISASTAPATTLITLKNPTDVLFFRPGMVCVASATDGAALAAGSPNTPGSFVVVSTDPELGTITTDGTITTQITGISTSWFLYRATLASDNGSGNGGFLGMEDWNPATPSASFLGVNQTLQPAMLSGVRTTDTSNVETIFLRAEAKAISQVGVGFMKGEIYLHPYQYMNLVSSKLNAVQIENDRTVELGIEKMKLGGFTFVKSPFCQPAVARMVAENNMELHTCGSQPTVGDVFRDPDVDQAKVQLNLDGNILTFRPSQNVRITLPSITIA